VSPRLLPQTGRRGQYGEARLAPALPKERIGMAIWIDVGAHRGERTAMPAQQDPNITVYAFEPNIEAISVQFAKNPNYIIIPVAISTKNQLVSYYINNIEVTNSLAPFNPEGLSVWQTPATLNNINHVLVPAIRLDTFMEYANIDKVDYLKIDTQGTDLEVVKSLGKRIYDVTRIMLEVQVTDIPLYVDGTTEGEVKAYMASHGFKLINETLQSYEQEKNIVFERG
jgi:FkbM family methyltransferase